MNRKIVGLLGALVLAIVGTIAIVAYVKGADDRAKKGERIINVLVVKTTVPAGTPSEQLEGHVKLEGVADKVKAEGAVTDVKALKGLVAGATLVPGEQVVRARFVSASSYRATGAAVQIPDGLMTTTIEVDPARALGGVLVPGDHVSVAASFDKDGTAPAQTHLILRKVLVTNVQLAGTTGNGNKSFTPSTNGNDKNGSQVEPGNSPSGQLLVTLALDAPSTERLVFGMEIGHVWLSIEPDNTPDGATKVVVRDNVFQ